jgi:hypothetical protein
VAEKIDTTVDTKEQSQDGISEALHRKWDIIFKWFGLAGALFAAGWTFYTYSQNRADDINRQRVLNEENRIARAKDQNSFIFQRQASMYLDASMSASTIAAALDPVTQNKNVIGPKALKEAREKFEELYWGPMVIVSDHRVEIAMVVFRECMLKKGKDCERQNVNRYGKPLDQAVVSSLGKPLLVNLSLELAACTRSALKEDRGIDFGGAIGGGVSKLPSEDLLKTVEVCPYD